MNQLTGHKVQVQGGYFEQRIGELHKQLHDESLNLCAANVKCDKLEAKVKRLNGVIDNYAQHLYDCKIYQHPTDLSSCTCGLKQALETESAWLRNVLDDAKLSVKKWPKWVVKQALETGGEK